YSKSFTDEASVIEAMGEAIVLMQGDTNNIKITTPSDLLVAESYFKSELV
ncbi:MAG: 2-C-methyl-D-erythritol 4-phosphate cytidylyltransferase, partial [Flavobacteriales bacterium]|nr:2-C-methyl-D-erythritol 4-phosphate cytidylyltransferase [Flavobacteriales bacterium]